MITKHQALAVSWRYSIGFSTRAEVKFYLYLTDWDPPKHDTDPLPLWCT